MKKSKVVLFNILLFIILFPIFDVIASNFFLKIDDAACHKIERYYYELKKNCIGNYKFKPSFPSVKVYTDEHGLRTGKKKKNKEANNNVLIFGDSMTFGVGLKYENTVVGILDKEISDYNFYNFAIGSYSPTVHVYKLKQAIKKNILPKKIILLLDISDIFDEGARWYVDDSYIPMLRSDFKYQTHIKEKKFTHKHLQVSRFIASTINSNLRILRHRIKNLNKSNNSSLKVKTSIQGSYTYRDIKSTSGTFWSDEIFSTGVEKVRKKISDISDLAIEHNSEFYLVIYPWGETLVYGQKLFSWENFVKDICLSVKCNLVNTFPEFRDKKNNDKFWYSNLYFIGDEHLNKKGNQFLARILINEIF